MILQLFSRLHCYRHFDSLLRCPRLLFLLPTNLSFTRNIIITYCSLDYKVEMQCKYSCSQPGQPSFRSRAETHPSLSARPTFPSSCHPAVFTSLILSSFITSSLNPKTNQSSVHLVPLDSSSPHPFTLITFSPHPVIPSFLLPFHPFSSIHPSFPNHPLPFHYFHAFIPPLESLPLPLPLSLPLPLPPARRYLCPSLAPSPCHQWLVHGSLCDTVINNS